jgi:hypothetical protein
MTVSDRENQLTHPEEFYRTLSAILTEENDSLVKLEENLDEQYQVLINQKLVEFLRVLKEQKGIIAKTHERDEMLFEEIRHYLPDLEDSSIGILINSSPDNVKIELTQLKAKFDRRVEQIQSKKDRNRVLIEKSLDMLQTQIQYLRDITQPGYDASGKQQSSEFPLINRQV